jgi:hypothetical protein
MSHRPIQDPPPTDKQTQDICYWLSRGAIPDTAIARAGIPRTVFNRWLRAGSAGQDPFTDFVAKVEHALIKFECELLDFFAKNANTNMSAATFLFNLRFGAKYKKIAEQEAGLEGIEAVLGAQVKPLLDASEEEIAAAEKRAMEAAKFIEHIKPKVLNFGLVGDKVKH